MKLFGAALLCRYRVFYGTSLVMMTVSWKGMLSCQASLQMCLLITTMTLKSRNPSHNYYKQNWKLTWKKCPPFLRSHGCLDVRISKETFTCWSRHAKRFANGWIIRILNKKQYKIVQSNLSIADMLNSGHLSIADKIVQNGRFPIYFLYNVPPNSGQF